MLWVAGPLSAAGGYAAAIIAVVFGIAFFGLNRAVVYSNNLPQPTKLDRTLYFLAIALYLVCLVVLIPSIFFLMRGLPLSLIGFVLVVMALLKWNIENGGRRGDEQEA